MKTLSSLLLPALLLGCSADREPGELFGPEESGLIVVDALLIVAAPLPDIFVRRTQPPTSQYSRETAAVTEADVVIRQGTVQYLYQADGDSAGRFTPPQDAPVVLPETEYHLEVGVGDIAVTAVTLTPPPMRIREAVLLDDQSLEIRRRLLAFGSQFDVYAAPENQLHYQDGVVELLIDAVDVEAYQLAIFSLDLDSDFVLAADFLEENDFAEFERFGASPALAVTDGKARLPWFAVVYGGRHLFKIYALDRNWYDYIRTSPDENDGPGSEVSPATTSSDRSSTSMEASASSAPLLSIPLDSSFFRNSAPDFSTIRPVRIQRAVLIARGSAVIVSYGAQNRRAVTR